MKPLAKRHCLRLGSLNEPNVIKAVWNIHLYDENVKVEQGPIEFGLVHCVAKNGWPHLLMDFWISELLGMDSLPFQLL
jgi:hypothetical protein